MPADERVLVIPTAHFHAAGYFHGFRPADDAYRTALLEPAVFTFRPRSEVETDPDFKQLIPYVILKCGDRVFHYRRSNVGTETRLRALRSIGIGGHISAEDAAGGVDPYLAGMRRELAEELDIRTDFRERWLGFINDDETSVGRVHLGVVHLLELASPNVVSKEDAIANAIFSPLTELLAARDEFETWSRFAFEALVEPSWSQPRLV